MENLKIQINSYKGLSFGNSHLDLRKQIDTLHSVLAK